MDYYDALGVSRTASSDEIKKAFRKKAHEYHPDKDKGDEKKFKEVNEAYQVLGDPEKRRRYDQFGSAGTGSGSASSGGFSQEDFMRQGPFGFGGGTSGFDFNLDDLGDIFGDVFGGGTSRRSARSMRGQDIRLEVKIPFEDSVFGSVRTFEIKKLSKCDVCGGSGAEPDSSSDACRACRGSGVIHQVQQTILGQIRTQAVCPNCHGEGAVVSKKCLHCRGEGVREKTSDMEVKIPAGIGDGQTIRLEGQGEAGQRNGTSGDLYLHVSVEPSKTFRREGDDLYSEVGITFPQAALGTTIEIDTIQGLGELKIPSGTQSGQVFRLKGKGVPRLQGSGKGDHFVTVNVVVPKKLSRSQKNLLKDFEDLG